MDRLANRSQKQAFHLIRYKQGSFGFQEYLRGGARALLLLDLGRIPVASTVLGIAGR